MSTQKMTVIKTRDGRTHNVREPEIRLERDAFDCQIETYGGQEIHCETGPALITENGDELYYCDGRRLSYEQYCERIKIEPHFYYLPNGATQRVWKSRYTHKIHRTDGPAIETSDGSYSAWLINGQYHRVGAPAIITAGNAAVEEMYYYNGKLHNPDGPAKVNHLTNRVSYYLNGKRLPKAEFMNKQRTRARMRQIVAQRTAYKAYVDAWKLFRSVLTSKTYKHGTSLQMVKLLNTISTLRHGVERTSAALGIYHATTREAMTTAEFSEIYDSMDEDAPSLYIMDAGTVNLTPYEVYLATFAIHSCNAASVFTAMSSDNETVHAFSAAIEDSAENTLPRDYRQFEPTAVSSDPPPIQDENEGEIFSWTLPLALAAGVGMLSKLYKTKKSVKRENIKEQACLTVQKK